MIPGADQTWMRHALALAALGEGKTAPNPQVGCVLVKDGVVVGAGFHERAGEPHAEAMALAQAGSRARGADCYVNLEPCSHEGRTPPCSRGLILAGVSRVVAAIQDPNPKVNGRGFEKLRAAGITVEVGVEKVAAERLNRGFLKWQASGRPWVTLKSAISLDGMLSGLDGVSQWITGPAARRLGHRLRLQHDAILVGAGTVRSDNPDLTVRLQDGERYGRRRLVLSSSADLDPTSRLFEPHPDSPVTVFSSHPNAPASIGSAKVETLPVGRGGVSVDALLAQLGADGVQSVLVEGGGSVAASFLSQGFVDQVALFVAPKLMGSVGGTPWLPFRSASHPSKAWRVEIEEQIPLGRDYCVWGRVVEGESCSQV